MPRLGRARPKRYPPPARVNPAPIAGLVDDFATLDTKWVTLGSPSISAGQVHLPCTLTYTSITSTGSGYGFVHQLTGSAVVVEAAQVPAAGNNTTQAYLFVASALGAGKNCVQISTGGSAGTLRLNAEKVTNGGAPVNLGFLTYYAVNHRCWRIRESGGSVFFEAGSDGVSWPYSIVAGGVTVASTALDPERCCVELGSGYWGTETPVDAVFDNLNLPPSAGVVNVETGTGVGGGTGAGARTVEHAKAGSGVGTGAPSGVKAVEHSKTGTVATARAALGAKVVEHPKTGLAAAAAAALGAKAIDHPKAGTSAGATAALGAKLLEHRKTGSSAGAAAASGTKTVVAAAAVVTKAGLAAAAAAASGGKLLEHTKAGAGVGTGASAGPKTVEHAKAGTGAGAGVGSGPETITRPRTGLAATAAAALGAKTLEHRKTGTAAGAGTAAGPKAVAVVVTKAGTAAGTGVPSGARTTDHPKAGLGAGACAASGPKTVTPATVSTKAGAGGAAGAPGGPVLILCGDLYAGAAASLSGPWATTANAVGPNTGDNAVFTADPAASGELELSSFGAQSAVPPGSVVQDVRVTVRHSVDAPGTIASLTAQAYLGAVAVGSAQALTASATPHEDTITVSGIAWVDLGDLRVRITAVRT